MLSRTSVALPISLVLGAMACSRSSDVPSMPDVSADPATASVADAIGDTFGLAGYAQWDVSSLTVRHEADGITVLLDFAQDVGLPIPGDPLLAGIEVTLQGAVIGLFDPGTPVELSNALRVTITQ